MTPVTRNPSPRFRTPSALLAAVILLAAPAAAQVAQPSARGLEDYSSSDGDYLSKDVRKRVQALKGSAWDQRMARQFGQDLGMPQAEVAKRVAILETWAREFARSGGPEVVAFEARLQTVQEGLDNAAAGRASLDAALKFVEDVALELQTKEEAPETYGRVERSGAQIVWTVGTGGISKSGHVVLVAPADLKLHRDDSTKDGFAALSLDGTPLPAAAAFEPPPWVPESLSLAWSLPEALDEGRTLELTLAVPPSTAAGTVLLIDINGKGSLVGPGEGPGSP